MSVHNTIKMECCLIKNTQNPEKNPITVNFLQHFFPKPLSTVTAGWLHVLPQLKFVWT